MDTRNITDETAYLIRSLQAWVTVASFLSLCGAFSVIGVYLCDKERRTHLFLILTFASFADIIVIASHIWGISMLDQYVRDVYTQGENGAFYVSVECGAQAVLAVYGTIASFQWITIFALYICAIHSGDCIDYCVKTETRRWEDDTKECIRNCFESQRCFACSHFVGWGIPIILIVLLGATASFGFEQDVDYGKRYNDIMG